jgi:excisionase family DNA binding protein
VTVAVMAPERSAGRAIVCGMSVIMSARQAAAHCGLSEKTVRRWIASGRLNADKVGRDFQVDLEQLAALYGQDRGQDADTGHDADKFVKPAGEASGFAAPTFADSAAFVELVRLVDRLQRENRSLAETSTSWQLRAELLAGELQQRDEQLKALQAPREEPMSIESVGAVPLAEEPPATPRPGRWRRAWHWLMEVSDA